MKFWAGKGIAKHRAIDIDISIAAGVLDNIKAEGRANRAGVVLPVDLGGRIVKYMIEEIKTSPTETTIGVCRYKEAVL